MTKIFADNASKYYESGYNIIPLRPNTKIPYPVNWQLACETRQLEFQIDGWIHSCADFNIGMPLGSANDIIAIDFDHNVDNLHDKLNDLLQGSPIKKKGYKGYTAFYKYNGERPKKWYKNGQAVVELLSTGNQTVMPPSIHPDTGQPYIWLTPDTLLDISAKELPSLPVDFMEKVDALFGIERKIIDVNKKYSGELPPLSEIEKALSFIPSNEYSIWITIGMALNHNYNDAGYNVWDGWSRKSPNYKPEDMLYKWSSFGKSRGHPVTIGSLFHFAIGYGYQLPRDEISLEIGADFRIFSSSYQPIVQKTTANDDFPVHLLDAPSLIGEVASWINATSIKRQPVLALGAAICAVGSLYAHRIRSESNLRTNFMVLGIAESSCGKEHARYCIDSLFTAAGIEQTILGDFSSDTSILTALQNNNGIGFALLDEIGREIKSLNSKGAGTHEGRILTTLMKMFSKAGGIYRGKQYANHDGKMDRKDLVQPCLNIYGTSVPKRFYDAMTTDDAIDGFLARWLVFESNDFAPPICKGGDISTPPQKILDAFKLIKAMPAYKQPPEGIIHLQPIPNPTIIPFSEAAEELLNNLTEVVEKNRIKEIERGGNLAPIWGRTREHAIKLALVAHPYEHGIIESVTMSWACELAMYLSHVAVKTINANVSDTDHEKTINKVLKVIKTFNTNNNNQFMPHYKLTRAVQFLKPRDRNDIINQLAESGQLDVNEEIGNNNKIAYSYMVK